jgi:3-hydroxybutyryl-CoA dehydratase
MKMGLAGGSNFAMLLGLHDLSVGITAARSVLIGEDEVRAFTRLTGDDAPVHTDETHARSMGYDRQVAHGLLVGSMYSRILGCELPGPRTVIMKLSLDMLKPVYIGDTIRYQVTVSRVSEAARSVVLDLSATNALGEEVSRGTAVCLYKC